MAGPQFDCQVKNSTKKRDEMREEEVAFVKLISSTN